MPNEKWLVSRAKTDKEAFLELYYNYYPKLFAFLLARTRNKELSEDVCQETFIKAIRALKNFQYKGHSFGAWLFKIAGNELISQWRRDRHKVVSSPDEMEKQMPLQDSIEDQFISQEIAQEDKEKLSRLLKAMEQLEKTEKELIIMKYFSGLDYKEIAVFYKKRPTTLAVELHRTLKKLKDILVKI